MNKKVWLIGSGVMSQDYFKVLKSLNCEIEVVGRGDASVAEFLKITGHTAQSGGLENFLQKKPAVATTAIVAVSRETLSEVTCKLLAYGVKSILVEKPAGLSQKEIQNIVDNAQDADVVIGFNRRFYSSVIEAKKLITADGGVKSFNFEFTEWSHRLKDLVSVKGEKVMATWFLGNSIHVADLAFYLGGFPKEMTSFVSGKIDWHPSSAVYSGAGISDNGALFSYNANWLSAGRWSVEWLTDNYRIVLRPLEEIAIQKKGKLNLEKVVIDDHLDKEFKPGLYLQTKQFLENNFSEFVDIKTYSIQFSDYLKISGYKG